MARMDGSESGAPSLCLLAHTDVVPVNENGWQRDPFGGELVDGEVWGRGAIDMLNMTASMALAMRALAVRRFRPRGDSVALPVLVAERGAIWPTLVVHGKPAHGSLPYVVDSALIKAAEVLRRIAAWECPPTVVDIWADFVGGIGLPPERVAGLTTPDSIDAVLPLLPEGVARLAFSSTRTTITPTAIESGPMTNAIPDEVRIRLDARTMPGVTDADVITVLEELLGDLRTEVDIELGDATASTCSPTNTPLWDSLTRVGDRFYPGAALLPMFMIGGTDARVFRMGNLGGQQKCNFV